MADRKKVIQALKCHANACCCIDEVTNTMCPYWDVKDCQYRALTDAAELLKEQEPVKPDLVGVDTWECGECGSLIGWEGFFITGVEMTQCKYCPNCGRRVKWDA